MRRAENRSEAEIGRDWMGRGPYAEKPDRRFGLAELLRVGWGCVVVFGSDQFAG